MWQEINGKFLSIYILNSLSKNTACLLLSSGFGFWHTWFSLTVFHCLQVHSIVMFLIIFLRIWIYPCLWTQKAVDVSQIFLHCLAATQCGRMVFTKVAPVAASETLDLGVLTELWGFSACFIPVHDINISLSQALKQENHELHKKLTNVAFFGMDCCVVSYQVLNV